MELQNYSVKDRVRKLKLSKKRKPSDVFSCFFKSSETEKPIEEFKAPRSQKNRLPKLFLGKPNPHKVSSNNVRERDRILIDRIKEKHPPEIAARYSKKDRRQFLGEFSPLEYQIFCRYSKQCRRQFRPSKRLPRKKKEPKTGKRLTYKKYIESDAWSSRKNRYYQAHQKRCAACDTYKHIHLHHMVYGQFDGTEPDDNLIPLCDDHHKKYHDTNGVQRDMRIKTLAFINEFRKALAA